MAKRDTLFDEFQHPKKKAFLRAYSETGSITRAAKAAKIDRTLVWIWRYKVDDGGEFKRACELAYEMAGDLLEEEAVRRAKDGCRRKKFHQGVAIVDPETDKQYEELEYSDTLLIFLLKGAKPEKYRERHDHSRTSDIDREFETLVAPLERAGQGADDPAGARETGGLSNGSGRRGGES